MVYSLQVGELALVVWAWDKFHSTLRIPFLNCCGTRVVTKCRKNKLGVQVNKMPIKVLATYL